MKKTPISVIKQTPKLALFGRPSLTDETGEIIPVPKSAFVIFTMAIIESNNFSIAKNKITEILWNGLDHKKRQSNLRTVVKRIRRIQESHGLLLFIFERELIKIDASAIDCDLRFVLQTIKLGDLSNILRASHLKFESLLEGYERVSVLFENWLDATRERITDQLTDLIRKALESRRFSRNPEIELSLANRVISLNPVAEEPYRTRLQVFRAARDRSGLERGLVELLTAYQRHLDSAPPAQLVSSYEEAIQELRSASRAATNFGDARGHQGCSVLS